MSLTEYLHRVLNIEWCPKEDIYFVVKSLVNMDVGMLLLDLAAIIKISLVFVSNIESVHAFCIFILRCVGRLD